MPCSFSLHQGSCSIPKLACEYAVERLADCCTFRVESSEAVTNFMSLGDRATFRTESLWKRMSCILQMQSIMPGSKAYEMR